MRWSVWLGSFGVVGLLISGTAGAARRNAGGPPSLRLRAVAADGAAAGGPAESLALPFRAHLPPRFVAGAQVAELGGTDANFTARLWLDQGEVGLRVAVEVADRAHHNDQAGPSLWEGDAVQLGLHPLGAGERLAAGTAEIGVAGDLLLSMALAQNRPAAFAHAGANGWTGPWRGPLEVERDGPGQRTRYVVTVPWAALGTEAGALTSLGLSLWVLDGGSAPGPSERAVPPRRLRYGATAAGGVRPCDMVQVDLGAPARPYAAFGPAQVREAAGEERLLVPLRASLPSGAGPLAVGLHCGGHTLALGGLPTHLHHVLQVDAASLCEPEDVTLAVYDKRGVPQTTWSEPLPRAAWHVVAAQRVLGRAEAEAERCHDAFAVGDARAARALLAQLVAEAAAAEEASPRGELAELARAARALSARYAEPAALRRALAGGELPALGVFLAAADQTLQPYLLFRPRRPAVEGAGPRPLLVFLHGRGDARLASFVAGAGAAGRASGGTVRGTQDGWVLLPWTRGNLGARHLGAQDVLQAVAQVQSAHGADPERTYLAGFSLGGSGAFDLAVHAPAPWAAVAIFSGGAWQVSLGHGLGQNARHLPFLLWHGDADGAVSVDNLARIRRELGGSPEVHIIPGGGHAFGEPEWGALQTFVAGRRRPVRRSWQYTADGSTWRQHGGVWLDVDAARSPFPRVTVTRTPAAGSTAGSPAPRVGEVRVQSVGTAGLELDLGPSGLDVGGETTVVYQGKRTYAGPPTRLTLGRGAPRP